MKKFSFFVFVSLCLFFTACKDEAQQVGRSLQAVDVIYTDTLDDIQVCTLAEDSMRTSKMSSEVFGWVEDPVFGRVHSDLYMQFRLSANAVNFGEGAVLDSVVLSLPYSGFFGDTANALNIGVYALDERMYKDSAYYSTRALKAGTENLAENTVLQLHPLTPSVVTGEVMDAQLRIPLKKDYFTQKFILQSGSENLLDNVHFLNYFKGLLLKAESKNGAGCLAYVDVLNALSAVTLYYHNDEHDSLSFQLVSNDSSVYYARIDHNAYKDAEADLRSQIVDRNYASAGRYLYVQASGGVRVQLRFPKLKSYFTEKFPGKRTVIHKAELVLDREGDASAYNPYFYPSNLTMFYKKDSASDKTYFLPDYLNIGNNYFGGAYQDSDSAYHFLLTEYVQYIQMGTLDVAYPIYLTVYGAATQATRVKLLGPSKTNKERRMRLIVTYSLVD